MRTGFRRREGTDRWRLKRVESCARQAKDIPQAARCGIELGAMESQRSGGPWAAAVASRTNRAQS